MPILTEIFKGLKPESRYFLMLLALTNIPVFLAAIVINIGSFQYKNDSTEINLKSKTEVEKISNDAEYSSRKTEDKLTNLDLKVDKLQQRRPRDPLVREVYREFKEFKPTAEEQLKKSEQVKKVLDSAIAQ